MKDGTHLNTRAVGIVCDASLMTMCAVVDIA